MHRLRCTYHSLSLAGANLRSLALDAFEELPTVEVLKDKVDVLV